jgi:hypothetical protein
MANISNVTVSKFGGLDWQDAVKALVLTVITSVLTIVYEGISNGAINWKAVGTIAATTAISYILKNWLSPTQIVISNPSAAVVQKVDDGAGVHVDGEVVVKKTV